MIYNDKDDVKIPMGKGHQQPDGKNSSLLYNEYPFIICTLMTVVILTNP